MSTQPGLFIEDIQDAMREIVRYLGGDKNGYQVVGCLLWPEKSPQQSGTLLANCLNANRAERLNPEQVFFLFRKAREAGFHNAKRWFDEATGYIPTEPLEPEDERAKLQREFIDSVRVQARIVDRIERLTAGPTLKAVSQ